MSTCRLCLKPIAIPGERWNEPLFESPNFVAVPSLGALVEGWVLLVPKPHVISFGALTKDLFPEMLAMKDAITAGLMQQYGPICIFEHGPSRERCRVGCGVDHAHLHFVPIEFDLRSAAAPFLPEDLIWSPAVIQDCQWAFFNEKDYLYVEQPLGRGSIAMSQAYGSQIFRRAIAKEIGRPDEFNWREYSHIENVTATARSFMHLWKTNTEVVA